MADISAMQKKLDKRFPKGTHIWANLGDGSGSVLTFLIPRPIVLNENEILLSPFNGELYFVVPADPMVDDGITITLTQGPRTFKLTPASKTAETLLATDVKRAFAAGFAESRRISD